MDCVKVELEGVARFPEEAGAWKVVDVEEDSGRDVIAGFGVWGFSERVSDVFYFVGGRGWVWEGAKTIFMFLKRTRKVQLSLESRARDVDNMREGATDIRQADDLVLNSKTALPLPAGTNLALRHKFTSAVQAMEQKYRPKGPYFELLERTPSTPPLLFPSQNPTKSKNSDHSTKLPTPRHRLPSRKRRT